MSKHKNDANINFKYIFTYDYNPVYVNGAHGGISPRGEIIMNFYLERMPLPNELSHAINPDGSIGDVVSVDPSDLNNSIIRYVPNGIILNLQSAVDLQNWLGSKIAELEQLTKARAEMSEEIDK